MNIPRSHIAQTSLSVDYPLKRAQFLLNPFGSGGDVYPCVTIGLELKKRGHDVRILTNPAYRSVCTGLGLRFADIGGKQDMEFIAQSVNLQEQRNAWRVSLKHGAVGTMDESFTKLIRCHKPGKTVIVGGPLSFGARIAAELHRIPMATLALSPFVIRTMIDSPKIPPLWMHRFVPKISKRFQWAVADQFVIDPLLRDDVNKFRSDHGLPAIRRFMNGWNLSPDLVLGLYPKALSSEEADYPSQMRLVGSVYWSPSGDAEKLRRVIDFANDGAPPILFLSGSVGNVAQRNYERVFNAMAANKMRMILIERNPNVLPESFPDHVIHEQNLPLKDVLPHCAAIVHSGGIGTVSHALAAAIPQLIVPDVNDQFDNAARVERIGGGYELPKKIFSAEKLCEQLLQLLGDDRVDEKCRELAIQMEDERAVFEACNSLEKLANVGEPTSHLESLPTEIHDSSVGPTMFPEQV